MVKYDPLLLKKVKPIVVRHARWKNLQDLTSNYQPALKRVSVKIHMRMRTQGPTSNGRCLLIARASYSYIALYSYVCPFKQSGTSTTS